MRYNLKILTVFCLMTTVLLAKTYKGAELRTTQAVRYGRFEVRMKSTAGSGVISSFFTYVSQYTGVDSWNEIDLEWLGRYDDRVQFNTITPGQVNHEHVQLLNYNPNAEFHEYVFEWTPVSVIWFVDGVQVYQQSYPADSHILTLNRDQKIMMNIWPSSNAGWAGDFNSNILPVYAYYDWVKYSSFTPGQGNTGTNSDFTLQWVDDFDSFDTSRWQKATHTWDGNLSDFITQNCVFVNGFMILCLTDATNTGFHGDPPVNLTPEEPIEPSHLTLQPAYPNPFNGMVQIKFEIPAAEMIQAEIFDVQGHRIKNSAPEYYDTGMHTINWNATNQAGKTVAGGVYLISLRSSTFQVSQKLVYLP